MHKKSTKILLASSSSYRKRLLQKIIPNFETASPNLDESKLPNESIRDLSGRLAKEKAFLLSEKYPNHLIVGSDQTACLTFNNQEILLKKPLTKKQCFAQLKQCQGRTVKFFTGLCLLNSSNFHAQVSIEEYETKFRTLNDEEIWHYIEREPALDCAGGFKMEGLGITLFEYIRGDDPNSLIGLPLIKLIDMLKKEGIHIL